MLSLSSMMLGAASDGCASVTWLSSASGDFDLDFECSSSYCSLMTLALSPISQLYYWSMMFDVLFAFRFRPAEGCLARVWMPLPIAWLVLAPLTKLLFWLASTD